MIIRLLCVNFYFNPKIREKKENFTNDLDKTNIMIIRMMFDDNNHYMCDIHDHTNGSKQNRIDDYNKKTIYN